MQSANDVFRANLDRVRAMHGLYLTLSKQVTGALDLTDLLRAEFVLIVSALDHFIHELALAGMLETWDGKRMATPTYQRFQIPLGGAALIADALLGRAQLEVEVRSRHSYLSFQQPDKIAEAIRHVSGVELWNVVAPAMGKSSDDVKAKLRLIIDRRNKIAHEADIDPSFPGQRWPISALDIDDALGFVEALGGAIYAAIRLP